MLRTIGSSQGLSRPKWDPQRPWEALIICHSRDRDRQEARFPGSCCGYIGLIFAWHKQGSITHLSPVWCQTTHTQENVCPHFKRKSFVFPFCGKKIVSRENRCETKEYIFLLLWLMDDPWEIGIFFVEIKGEIREPRAGFWSPWSPDTMDISVKMATTVWFRGGNCYVLGSGGSGLVTDALAWEWKRKAI